MYYQSMNYLLVGGRCMDADYATDNIFLNNKNYNENKQTRTNQ